jgi:DMSO/TMAO reductase YedYZ heme-binding membrane subunit
MSHAYWYATRASGVVSLVLLTAVVALGVAGSLRLRSERWPRFVVTGLHRNLTLLTLAFLTGHVVTTLLDSFTPIGVRDAFIPFLASYRPIWLGLGAVAFDLLLALTVTSLLRARVGYRAWRSLHWLAYAAWPVALAHGLGTGSDARFGWLQALAAGCVLLVVAALAARLYSSPAAPARRLLAAFGAACVLVAGAAWYAGGPGAKGWASRAGTPSALLPKTSRTVSRVAAPARQQPVDLPAAPFTAQLSGQISSVVESGTGLVRVDIRARTSGTVDGRLWIRLQGSPLDDGGVSMNASGVAFGPSAAPNAYVGTITALQGTELSLSLHNANGRKVALDVLLNVDQATRHVTGTLRAVQ